MPSGLDGHGPGNKFRGDTLKQPSSDAIKLSICLGIIHFGLFVNLFLGEPAYRAHRKLKYIIHFGVSVTVSLCWRPMAASVQRSIRKQRERKILLDLLRNLRKQKGLTQDQMAKAVGAKQAFVSKYETGERRLDFLDLVAICEVLGISILKFAERFETARKVLR
jgi:DNA-binding XRE family transcriptional regulator